jgi:VWFA-related protein
MIRCGGVAAFGICLALSMAAQQSDSIPAPAGQAEASPQTPPVKLITRSHDERESSYRVQHRIILNVQVTDEAGKPAGQLEPSDFTLIDGQETRKIASLRAAAGSTAMGHAHAMIVFDTVNNSGRNLGIQRREVEKFLERYRGRIEYPISLVLLTSAGARVGHSSRDASVLEGELREMAEKLRPMECGDEGGLDLYHARSDVYASTDAYEPTVDMNSHDKAGARGRIADCLNQKFTITVSALNKIAKEQVNVPGRAIVIWLGASWPLLLGPEFRRETPGEAHSHFDYLADLSASLREGQVTLDSVSSPDLFRRTESGAEKLAADPAPATDQANTGDFALPVLVRQTGGQDLEYSKDLAGEIAECIADAESYYVLSFDAEPATGVGEYRTLEVKVNRPGLKVRTNAAYFAQP